MSFVGRKDLFHSIGTEGIVRIENTDDIGLGHSYELLLGPCVAQVLGIALYADAGFMREFGVDLRRVISARIVEDKAVPMFGFLGAD
jgi:hypothetical protein